MGRQSMRLHGELIMMSTLKNGVQNIKGDKSSRLSDSLQRNIISQQ